MISERETNPSNRCRVQVLNRQKRFEFARGAVAGFCRNVLAALDAGPCGLSIVFAGSRTMRSLNRTWLGRDYATDVLSFPYGEKIDGADFLGEVVIAPAVAAEHARQRRTTFEREIRVLIVHGILHLLGYDHEKDRGRMLRLQARLMEMAGFTAEAQRARGKRKERK